VAAWRRANEIRAYVAAVRVEAEESGAEVKPELGEWEQWSMRVAAEMDPVGARLKACSA